MAGRLIAAVHLTPITGAATGIVTVGSTTGLYASAKAWIGATGQPSRLVTIVNVIDATHVQVRFDLDPHGGGQGTTPNDLIGIYPNYGYSDVSAYSGAGSTLDQMDQFIYNKNDAPLT